MQTYTHLVVGLVAGKILFPHNLYAQTACVFGSVLPDLVMVPKFALDKIRGKEPMAEQSDALMTVKEISHSLPLWVYVALFGSGYGMGVISQFILAFSLGGILHIFADVLTHRDLQYRKYDLSCMWPMNICLNLTLYGFAPWEYRKANGDLTPKIGEGIILAILIITYTFLWIR